MNRRAIQIVFAGVFAASLLWLCLVVSQHLYGWPIKLTAALSEHELKAAGQGGAAVIRLPVIENQPGRLWEDAREIGIPAPKISEVTEQGGGRFKAKAGQLFFSSSDGSRPSENGRAYVFRYPWKSIPSLSILAGALAFFVSGGALMLLHRGSARRLMARLASRDSFAGRAFERIQFFFSDRDAFFENQAPGKPEVTPTHP